MTWSIVGSAKLALLTSLIAVGAAMAAPGPAEDPPSQHTMRQALVLPRPTTPGDHPRRSPVHVDLIEAQLVGGTWTEPVDGGQLPIPGAEPLLWTLKETADNGVLRDRALRGGYAYWSVDSDEDRIMILDAAGHGMGYVNGVPRAGDVYSNGRMRLPVELNKGRNDFLFRCARGSLRAKLIEPKGPAFFDLHDLTLPDIIEGENWAVHGGVVIVNATAEPLTDLFIHSGGSGLPARKTPVPVIGPMTVRKVPFFLGGAVEPGARICEIELELFRNEAGVKRIIDSRQIKVRIRRDDEKHKRTFISEIDGSVQYYAVTPMREDGKSNAGVNLSDADQPALFLTLHGASVEGEGQARVYSHKDWGHVVAPTNRRPYGFDWEDWGRLDALEVLEINKKRLNIDPNRVYLTGHSMGGHGTWQVGVTHPDKFAAIAPSAGWVSFWSYTGAQKYEDTEGIEELLNRATNAGDTAALARNFLHYGIYILHGEKDDNVPAEQAHMMTSLLEGFHPDYTYHEQPGAGHWWGGQCCDWPPLFDFFAQRTRPRDSEVDEIEFWTANPGISAWSRWVGIEQQIEHLQFSSVRATRDAQARRFEIETNNIARLALKIDDLLGPGEITVEIDGERITDIPWPENGMQIWLMRDGRGTKWTVDGEPLSGDEKGPHRYGPFKDAFRNRMIFVYGTRGTDEENDWNYAKARYDAESFWYRGNGSIDVIADTEFDPAAEPDRGVIIYGNADTNAAWEPLLGEAPVQVRRGIIRIGSRELAGDDLGCLFLRPRPGSDTASVGAVSGSGLPGLRVTERLPYFLAGVGYPDFLVISPEVLTEGAAGVRAAGYFGLDWSVDEGQSAIRP